MNETLQFIILGVTQGITEWLPISSSGHLVIVSDLLGLTQDTALDVLLHLASLIVLLFYFKREIWRLIVSLTKREATEDHNYILKIVITTLITIIIALAIEPYLEGVQNVRAVAWFLLGTTIVLVATKFSKGDGTITWATAGILGLVQGLAVLPGFSRSGLMIGIALLLGIQKQSAFRYAFLAGIPAIFGAFLLTISDVHLSLNIILSFVVTLFVSFLVLKLLEFVVNQDKFFWFAAYTGLVGILILTL